MKFRGSVEVPNLSDENDTDDLDVSLTNISHTTVIGRIDRELINTLLCRSQCLCVKTNPTRRSWTS